MSANYWESTHHKHWLFTKDQLASMRRKLGTDNAEIVQTFTLPEMRHLYIYFNQRELWPLPISAAVDAFSRLGLHG